MLTREQVRELDRLAVEELGIPGVVLMENAGRAVAEVVLELLDFDLQMVPPDCSIVVVCGGGNNGGDGYVIARHLHNAGARVSVFATTDPATLGGDALAQAQVAVNMGLPIELVTADHQAVGLARTWRDAHVIVDALLGTGFRGEVRPPVSRVIEQINEARVAGAKVVAVDLPSGLDCDTGGVAGPAVRADITVTFVDVKPAFERESAEDFVGSVHVAQIGTPPELAHRVRAAS